MITTVSYSSFPDPPHFGDNSCVSFPDEQLSRMDASIPIGGDVNLIDISMSGNEDCVPGLNHLGFHLAPSTPTKERTRRATMPDSMKPGLQQVFLSLPSIICVMLME